MESVAHLGAVLLWVSLALVIYTYVGYPLLLLAVGIFVRKVKAQPGYAPPVSVLIAARNEEANIGRKIRETLDLDYPADRLEVLVVSDGSTDRTDAIVRAFGDPRVRLLRVDAHRGKTHAQNEGVKECAGEVIVFSDATAVYDAKAIRYLASNYCDPRVGAVSGRYFYMDAGGKSPTGFGSAVFWNYENLIKRLQSRVYSLTGCSGCIYSVRKSLYVPLQDAACSDLVEPLQILKQGYRIVFEDRAHAYEETTKSASEEFGMRVRVFTRGIRGLLSVPQLFRFWRYGWVSFQLISHKLLRWMLPVLLLGVFVGNALLIAAGNAQFRWLFAAQAAFYLFALFSLVVPLHRRWKLLGLPLYFCTVNAAALFGIFRLVGGQKYVVWETVRRQSDAH